MKITKLKMNICLSHIAYTKMVGCTFSNKNFLCKAFFYQNSEVFTIFQINYNFAFLGQTHNYKIQGYFTIVYTFQSHSTILSKNQPTVHFLSPYIAFLYIFLQISQNLCQFFKY